MTPSRVSSRAGQPRAATSTQVVEEAKSSGGQDFSSAKALIGTLLGAAGGAAVAYAMMRAESEDEMERERAAVKEVPTHQITMVDREVDARASDPGINRGESDAGSIRSNNPNRTQEDAPSTRQSVLGTLISTFIPPSSVPRLLLEAGPSTSTNTTETVTSSRPRSSNNNSNATTVVSARNIPLPSSSSGVGTTSSSTTNKTGSTLKAARDLPLPASSRATTVVSVSVAGTVTPSESISNAGSKKTSRVAIDRQSQTSGSTKTTMIGGSESHKSSRSPSSSSSSSSSQTKTKRSNTGPRRGHSSSTSTAQISPLSSSPLRREIRSE